MDPEVAAGFLNICKAPSFSSHDVVAVARRILRTRRVGHAGTLDPAAEGVLPLCVGRATRLAERLADAQKGYYAEIVLGVRTHTDDAEGDVLERASVPAMDRADVAAALEAFEGRLEQRPPAFSAVKVQGQRAYRIARRGEDTELRPRSVTVHRLTLSWWRPPRLALSIACSKGTYVRAIARDLGAALGCGAHLARLVRLWVGDFRLADSVSLDELAQAAREGSPERYVIPSDVILGDLPVAIVQPVRLDDMGQGRAWPAQDRQASSPSADLTRIYDTHGTFLGLASSDRRRAFWQPRLAVSRQPVVSSGRHQAAALADG